MDSFLSCPNCGSKNCIKYGKRKNKQRFKCNDCNKIFLKSTKTVLSSRKLDDDKFYQMINLMINDTKLRTICDLLNIST